MGSGLGIVLPVPIRQGAGLPVENPVGVNSFVDVMRAIEVEMPEVLPYLEVVRAWEDRGLRCVMARRYSFLVCDLVGIPQIYGVLFPSLSSLGLSMDDAVLRADVLGVGVKVGISIKNEELEGLVSALRRMGAKDLADDLVAVDDKEYEAYDAQAPVVRYTGEEHWWGWVRNHLDMDEAFQVMRSRMTLFQVGKYVAITAPVWKFRSLLEEYRK